MLGVAFAPDNKTLATAHLDHTILLHDIGTGRQTGLALTEHTNRVHAIAFTVDGKFMLSGDSDGQVLLRDNQTLKLIGPPWKASRGVSRIAVSPDGKNVVTANWDGTIALWDQGRKDALAFTLPPGQDDVSSIAFSSDGRLLISGGYDRTTILWDTSTKRRVTSLPTGHQASVQSVAFSPDGSRFASSDGKGRVVVGGTAEGVTSGRSPTGRDVQSNVEFTADGAALLYGTADGVVLWDVERGVESANRQIPNGAPVRNVAYNKATGVAAVSDHGGSITLLDARTLKRKAVGAPMAHAMNVTSLAFSPNGRMLASASFDGAIVLWSVSEGGRIWEASRAHGEEPLSVAFSPDGALLASGSADGNVLLWDVATGQAIGAPLPAHPGGVDAVAFSPDGRSLASAGRGAVGGVKLWEIRSTDWRARACAMANRELTDAEWRRYVGETRRRTTCSGSG